MAKKSTFGTNKKQKVAAKAMQPFDEIKKTGTLLQIKKMPKKRA
jgi:hypothetical protein